MNLPSRPFKIGQVFLLVAKPEKDDEDNIQTPENYHVLWAPRTIPEVYQTVKASLHGGEGENREIRRAIARGNYGGGSVQVDLFERHLLYIQHDLKGWTEFQFVHTLALTRAAAWLPYWIMENNHREDTVKLFKDLAKIWRTFLLKKTDEEIGIDPPSNDPSKSTAEGISSSRQALYYCLLESYAKEFEQQSDKDHKIKFNWKPGKPRNPKGINGRKRKEVPP